MSARILGISASLRNARWGIGNEKLIADLASCATEDELFAYLTDQAGLHLQNFVDAGRAEGLSFDEIYKRLRSLPGDCGLSNSEIALAAALWSARQGGCEIDHISLSEFFPASGATRSLDRLKRLLRESDGIILSTPVYFGDRSSVAGELINLIRNDEQLRRDVESKLYVGIAVGAKRNGGQETTLIYQLFDMLNVGFWGLGNDSETTAQYGGTGHAGDVGTMTEDSYGLATSMGAGRRIAHMARLRELGHSTDLVGPLRLQFWILQDADGRAENYVRELVAASRGDVDASILNLTENRVTRCIACDICPTHISVDREYRCIIRPSGRDQMGNLHEHLLGHDAIVPVIYSAVDRERLVTRYQEFIERTRYLRRGDYALSDTCVAPLVLEELGAHENMHVRCMTSLLRQHTVMFRPVVAYQHECNTLNGEQVAETFDTFLNAARVLTAGRLLKTLLDDTDGTTRYNPVGYVLSAEKDLEDEREHRRDGMLHDRRLAQLNEAMARLPALKRKAA